MIDSCKYWFWRAQLSILRACQPLLSVVADHSLGRANSVKGWIKTLFYVAVQGPRAVFADWRNKRRRRVVLARIFIPVTTRCTLNCTNCSMRIPYRKNHSDIPMGDLLGDTRALLDCIDYVYHIFLAGGEPFLHPDLDKMIGLCAASGKVGRVTVVTNGTVAPDERTLTALKKAGAAVQISKYNSSVQPNMEGLTSVFDKCGIHWFFAGNTFWFDTGGFGQPQSGPASRRFSVCFQLVCMLFYRGKLHLCMESSLMLEAGLIPDCAADYIDIRAIDPAVFREKWQVLRKKHALSACSNCQGHNYKSLKVPVAAQREKGGPTE